MKEMTEISLIDRLREFLETEARSGSMENFWFMVHDYDYDYR